MVSSPKRCAAENSACSPWKVISGLFFSSNSISTGPGPFFTGLRSHEVRRIELKQLVPIVRFFLCFRIERRIVLFLKSSHRLFKALSCFYHFFFPRIFLPSVRALKAHPLPAVNCSCKLQETPLAGKIFRFSFPWLRTFEPVHSRFSCPVFFCISVLLLIANPCPPVQTASLFSDQTRARLAQFLLPLLSFSLFYSYFF